MLTKIIPTGSYEAQLTRISLNDRGDISCGASAWFLIPAVGQTVKYYVKPIEEDLSFSLKRLAYFLDSPYDDSEEFNYLQLLGRYCQLKIQSVNSNGRRYPRIDGFSFSQHQLFRGLDDDE